MVMMASVFDQVLDEGAAKVARRCRPPFTIAGLGGAPTSDIESALRPHCGTEAVQYLSDVVKRYESSCRPRSAERWQRVILNSRPAKLSGAAWEEVIGLLRHSVKLPPRKKGTRPLDRAAQPQPAQAESIDRLSASLNAEYRAFVIELEQNISQAQEAQAEVVKFGRRVDELPTGDLSRRIWYSMKSLVKHRPRAFMRRWQDRGRARTRRALAQKVMGARHPAVMRRIRTAPKEKNLSTGDMQTFVQTLAETIPLEAKSPDKIETVKAKVRGCVRRCRWARGAAGCRLIVIVFLPRTLSATQESSEKPESTPEDDTLLLFLKTCSGKTITVGSVKSSYSIEQVKAKVRVHGALGPQRVVTFACTDMVVHAVFRSQQLDPRPGGRPSEPAEADLRREAAPRWLQARSMQHPKREHAASGSWSRGRGVHPIRGKG